MQTHSITLTGAILLLVVISGSGIIALQAKSESEADATLAYSPRPLQISSVAELSKLFADLAYEWPPQDLESVPAVILQSLPTDLADIRDVSERKSLFLRSLLPIVLLENQRLREQRSLAKLMLEQGPPAKNSKAHAWLTDVARGMKLSGELDDQQLQRQLLRRLDEIPLSLALAQAAIESGWGTSRFAREGNSLFGQWTYLANKGIEPSQRDEDANHLVRAFPHLQASVRAYMHNLNTNRAYREFRAARAGMRENGEELSSLQLAEHLRRYSQRDMDYVRELQKMINSQSLALLEEAGLLATLLPATLPAPAS